MHFLQQKMRLLLTHLKHLVSHLPNPAVHELCRGETHPTGLRSCEAPVPGHKLMCTAAPQLFIKPGMHQSSPSGPHSCANRVWCNKSQLPELEGWYREP